MRERRSRVRLPVPADVIYRVSGSIGLPRTAQASEISGKGLRFVTTESLPEGMLLDLTVKLASLFEPVVTSGKVLWQRTVTSQFLRDTCVQFTRIDPPDVNRLLKELHRIIHKTSTSRRYVRVSLITDVECVPEADLMQRQHGVSVDIGVGGIRAFFTKPLPESGRVALMFVLAGHPERIRLRARVLWQRNMPDSGVETGFVFEQPEAVLIEAILSYIKQQLYLE